MERFIFILALFQICFCQQEVLNPTPRIINGTDASVEQSKYVVSIRMKGADKKFGNGHICGGSLIGPRKVLTAAHCLYDSQKKKYRKAKDFIVVMGTLNRFQRLNGTIVSEVTSIAYMDSFYMGDMRDDVGVMFLKTGLPANKTHFTVEPIAMAEQSTPNGASCQVSGWGKTKTSSMSNVLLTANVTIVPRNICARSYALISSDIKQGMICAGMGGTDSCQGDSGGPLVYNNTLIGIVSWGYDCAQYGFPGIYSEVTYYRDWIEAKFSKCAPEQHLAY